MALHAAAGAPRSALGRSLYAIEMTVAFPGRCLAATGVEFCASRAERPLRRGSVHDPHDIRHDPIQFEVLRRGEAT
jgi:hypothetical protein